MKRNRNYKAVAVLVCGCVALMVMGCATSSELMALKEQTEQALQRANLALKTSQETKGMVMDANEQSRAAVSAGASAQKSADQAGDAATRAENAAGKAEAMANKAEAIANKTESIFMKQMKK